MGSLRPSDQRTLWPEDMASRLAISLSPPVAADGRAEGKANSPPLFRVGKLESERSGGRLGEFPLK